MGFAPSFSAHVRWCEHGAPVRFPPAFDFDIGSCGTDRVADGVLSGHGLGGVELRCGPVFVDGGVVQSQAGPVFRGEDGSVFLGPRYFQRGIVPEDGSLVLGGPEVGGFVEDFCSVRENHEAVSEAGGNPEHFAVGSGEGFGHPLAEGGRVAA
jgi:hypothetical protein